LDQKHFGRKFVMVSKSFSRKQLVTKNFHEKNWSKIFIFAKSIHRKQVPTNKFSTKIFWSKIFCLQNYFLENRIQKLFSPKLFMVTESFPRKQFPIKHICGDIFRREFLSLLNHLFDKWLLKKLSYKFFGGKFLNHFLENGFLPKIFIKNLLVEVF
jgi:hypothetical protein